MSCHERIKGKIVAEHPWGTCAVCLVRDRSVVELLQAGESKCLRVCINLFTEIFCHTINRSGFTADDSFVHGRLKEDGGTIV